MADIVHDSIWELIDSRYVDSDGRIITYATTGDEDEGPYLANEISNICEKYCEQYQVEHHDIFDSPGYDTGVISVAYIFEGKLNSFVVQWERC